MSNRRAEISRKTRETDIRLRLDLDGTGTSQISTEVGFFDHMLCHLARHGLLDLEIEASGDLEVDAHHLVEDVGIVLGQALAQALGDKAGLRRYGQALAPMDEALVVVALDLSGRPTLEYRFELQSAKTGDFDTELAREFFQAVVSNARITLHLHQMAGRNTHHVLEAAFKGFGRALDQATSIDPRLAGDIPSTKGML